MGFATTFATMSFIIVFLGATVFFLSTQHALTASATEIKQAQARIITQQQQDVSILSTLYQQSPFVDWDVDSQAEFDEGEFFATQVISGVLQLQAPASDGDYNSSIYDSGFANNFSTLSFSSVEPGGSSVEFQVRTADTVPNLLAATFIGPDGTPGSVYSTTGTSLASVHDGDRFIQWQAVLSSAGPNEPTLDSVSIGVQRQTDEVLLVLENTGKAKLHFEETDVYQGAQRFTRGVSSRRLVYEQNFDSQLWNPGENLNISVYTSFTGTELFTVVNEFARDSTEVTG